MNPRNPVTAEDCELTDEAASALLSSGEYSASDIALMPNCEVISAFIQDDDGFSYTSNKEIFRSGYGANKAGKSPDLPLKLLGELLSAVAKSKGSDGTSVEVEIKFNVTCFNNIFVSKVFSRTPTNDQMDFELTDEARDALRLKLAHVGADEHIARLSFGQVEEMFEAHGGMFRLVGFVHPLTAVLTDIDAVDATQFVEANHAKLMAEYEKYEANDVYHGYVRAVTAYASFNATEVKTVKVSKIFKELAVAEASASGNVAT